MSTRLVSAEELDEANKYWFNALELAESHSDCEMQQVAGWTLLVQTHFLSLEKKYSEALKTLERAESVLKAINNYAGIAFVNEVITGIYLPLNDKIRE